jgi:hypothetical protein
MNLDRWIPAHVAAQRYAVSEAILFRYCQRGMIGARWDEPSRSWSYDVCRLRELFLVRGEAAKARSDESFGILGQTRLAAFRGQRRPPVTRAESKLHEKPLDGLALQRAS